jgi:hypothetical protein
MQQNPSRKIELDFNIENIKSKIDYVIEISGKEFQLKDKNDLFNTYRIVANFGFNVCVINITLNKINENKTELYSEIINSSVTKDQPAVLAKYQDQFLNLLSKALNGEILNAEVIKSNTSGCLGFIAFIFALTSMLSSIIFQ